MIAISINLVQKHLSLSRAEEKVPPNPYRGTSLIRNRPPPRTTVGP
jgi:hypothetical protein